MLDFFCAFGPARLESGVGDIGIADHFGVADDHVVAGTGFEQLLLDGEPAGLVEPDLNLRKLLEDIVGFGSEFEFDRLSIVYGSFADKRNPVASAQLFSTRAEAEQQELIDQSSILAEVEFLDAFEAGLVDEKIVAVAEDRTRVGSFQVEQHAIATDEDRAVFCGAIVYDYRDLRALNIGGKAAEVSGGIVQVRQEIIERELAVVLGGVGRSESEGEPKNCRKNE